MQQRPRSESRQKEWRCSAGSGLPAMAIFVLQYGHSFSVGFAGGAGFLYSLFNWRITKEHNKGHDQEIDQLGDEQAVSNNGGLLLCGLQGCVVLAV